VPLPLNTAWSQFSFPPGTMLPLLEVVLPGVSVATDEGAPQVAA